MRWTALLAPACGWFAQLTASYTMAVYACKNHQVWIFHAISAAALVLAGLGIWSGWRCWRMGSRPHRGSERGTVLFTGGNLSLAILFLLAILANEVSNWMLLPCL